jgi:myo-inositol 2-dehydrogenase / D-chiro-inositol 1-dehydrogenase
MTTSSLRVGVLGCGRIGRMHAELIARQVEGLTLAACYDFVPELAADVALRNGGRAIEDPYDLIESPDVDAIAICSPTDFHVDQLVAAAKAGKPVLVEKPLSLDLAQVDLGVAAVNSAGIPVQVGFNRRFDTSHRSVRDQVAAGAVGDVHLVRITSRDPAPPPVSYIETSGGIFLDMTIHDFDMARFVTGSEVTEVYARGSVRVDPAIGEAGDLDTVVVVLQHENGAVTTIDNSRQAVYGYDQRVEAFGSAGVVSSDNPGVTTTMLRTANGSHGSTIPYFFIERYLPSYIAEWNAFVAMVRDDTPSPVTIDDGRAPLLLGLAAWKSVREQRPVAVSEIG